MCTLVSVYCALCSNSLLLTFLKSLKSVTPFARHWELLPTAFANLFKYSATKIFGRTFIEGRTVEAPLGKSKTSKKSCVDFGYASRTRARKTFSAISNLGLDLGAVSFFTVFGVGSMIGAVKIFCLLMTFSLWLKSKPASVDQLVRTSSIMCVVMSSSSEWSEKFLIYRITYDFRCDYRRMAKWFGAHYNQEVRFSSAVKCKKGPQVLTSLLNQRRNYNFYLRHNKMDFSTWVNYGIRSIINNYDNIDYKRFYCSDSEPQFALFKVTKNFETSQIFTIKFLHKVCG